ncbi:MAG: T9SS type A sorting domain-containing protein, partial [Flavobacteriaceae bacterium]|nr:T9SS type A sorting domain-containing protein [Flavobacteriaceae bacterium]
DETAPEIADVPDFQLDTCNEDWPTKLTTTWSDNCAAGGSIDSDAGVPDGESADGCIQYRLYTFTVTDDCGNSDTETTRVAREYDETKPEIADVPDFQLDTCNEDWPTKLTTTWTDNCADGGSVESDAGVADGESADGCIQYRLYTFTVTDDCGNSDTETTRVAREYDMTDPVFINIPDDIVLDCSEDIPAMTELEWTDNCSGTGKVFGEDSEIEGACGIITRTWTYTDECGNTATATQMITIEDNEPPVLECVCDIMVGNSESTDCEAYVNINNVIATDNCGEPTLTYSHDINGTFPIGDTVVTVTAEDSCGNKSTCEFTITVVNNCMTDCCEVGNKPSVMTFTYTGEDCSATMTTQGADKYGCNGDPAMAPTVYIIASSGDNGSGEVYFSGEVNLNEFYTISAANAGQSQLNNNTIITIYDSEGGNILQVSNFHASCSQPLGSGDQFGANLINGIQFDDGYVCGEVDAPPIPEDCCDLGSKPSIMTFTYTGEDCSASMNTQDPSKAECLGDPAMSASVFIVVSDGGSEIYFEGTVGINEMYTISAANAGQTQLNNNTIIYIYAYEGGPLLQESNFHASCSQPLGSGNQFGANYVNGIQFDNGYVCGEVDAPPIPEDCCDLGSKPSVMTFTYTGEDCSASIGTQDPDKAECAGDPGMDDSVYIVASDGGSEIYFEGTVGINEMYTISAASAGATSLNNNTIIYIYEFEGGPLLQEANFHASCSQPLGSGNQFGANYVNGIQFDNGYVCGEVDAPPIPEDCCDSGYKPTMISFKYTGEDCSANATQQSADKYSCDTYSALPDTVYIIASSGEDGSGDIWFSGEVGLNQSYTIYSQYSGADNFPSNTVITIYDGLGGSILQRSNFHTSCSQPLGSGNQFGANLIEGILFNDGYICGQVCLPPESEIPEDCCDLGSKPSVMTFTYTGEDCSASIGTQDPDKAECLGDPAMAASVYIVASDGGSEIYFEGTVGINEMYTISASNAGQGSLNNNTIIYIYAYEGGPLLQEANFHASCSQPLGSGNQFGANYVNGILFDNGYVCGEVDAPPIPEDCCDIGDKPSVMTFTYTGEDCSASNTGQDPDKAECLGDPGMASSVYIVASNGGSDIYFAGTVGLNETYTISASNAGQNSLSSNSILYIYAYEGGPLLQESNFHTSCSQPLGSGNQFGANYVNGILFDNGYVCGEVDAPPAPADCCDVGNKPSVMTFKYTGEDCTASNNTQDPSKAECSGDPGFATSVYIVASDGGSEIYFSNIVGLNETYTISAANAGQNTLNNNSIIYIYAYEGGPLLQEANFHASCSQPLGAGNQFGANFVQSILFEDGYYCEFVDEQPNEINNNGDVNFGKTILTPDENIIMNVYPNPFKLSASINFTMVNDDKVTVEVYNLRGQLVETLFQGQIRGGQFNQVTFNPKETMAAGIYLVKLYSESGIVQHKRLIYRP